MNEARHHIGEAIKHFKAFSRVFPLRDQYDQQLVDHTLRRLQKCEEITRTWSKEYHFRVIGSWGTPKGYRNDYRN